MLSSPSFEIAFPPPSENSFRYLRHKNKKGGGDILLNPGQESPFSSPEGIPDQIGLRLPGRFKALLNEIAARHQNAF